jgi:hypothetical protein
MDQKIKVDDKVTGKTVYKCPICERFYGTKELQEKCVDDHTHTLCD